MCIFTHGRTKVSRRVDRMVMTKACACALYLITKWTGGSHFKFYASHFYAVGLHIIPVKSVISRVKIKERSVHQV